MVSLNPPHNLPVLKSLHHKPKLVTVAKISHVFSPGHYFRYVLKKVENVRNCFRILCTASSPLEMAEMFINRRMDKQAVI